MNRLGGTFRIGVTGPTVQLQRSGLHSAEYGMVWVVRGRGELLGIGDATLPLRSGMLFQAFPASRLVAVTPPLRLAVETLVDPGAGLLREFVEILAGILVAPALSAVRVVQRRARVQHLVAAADVVPGFFEHERERRDRPVPHRASKEGAQSRLPEVAS